MKIIIIKLFHDCISLMKPTLTLSKYFSSRSLLLWLFPVYADRQLQ